MQVNSLIMLSVNLTYLLLFLTICAVNSFPSSLTDRSQEISWQAWLLVDDQNQNQRSQGDGTIPRRRITAKSVFDAPTFTPESLPPCADGYSSDSMGRCIKIIKLDEAKHLEFLVDKLNDKFGPIDYEEEVEIEAFDGSKSEPFQLNIPLAGEDDYSNDTPLDEVDIAIIVTPMSRETEKNKDEDVKGKDKRDNEEKYEEELKNLLKTSTEVYEDERTTTVMLEQDTTTTHSSLDDVERTTTFEYEEDLYTTAQSTVDTESTTENLDIESTTNYVANGPTETPATTLPEETTTTEVDLTTGTTIVEAKKPFTTTTPKITTYHPMATTYHPPSDWSRFVVRKQNMVRFPDERRNLNYVRFPDVDSRYQQEGSGHYTRDVNEQFGNFFNEIVTSEPSERHQVVLPHTERFEYKVGATTEKPLNRRNREKQNGFFFLPQRWSSKNPQKPLVLRFSRKHVYVDTRQFKNNEFYRSLPMEDLSFLFGYKHKQSNR